MTTDAQTVERIISECLTDTHANSELLRSIHHGTKSLEEDIQTITSSYDTSQANLKVTIAVTVAKLVHPDWDTRKHQESLGGKFSLRSFDEKYISQRLYADGLYATPTPYALSSRTFEKAEPFTASYTGRTKQKTHIAAFLNIVQSINEEYTEPLCLAILTVCLKCLRERRETKDALRTSSVSSSATISLRSVETLLTRIFTTPSSGFAVTPVLAMWTACTLAQPYLWPNCSIKPLKQHTAADGVSKAWGDVEGVRLTDGTPFLAVEVKHKIAITPTIVASFDAKTPAIPLRYIITTSPQAFTSTDTNIIIAPVVTTVLQLLQSCLFHAPSIAATYVQEFYTMVVGYANLSVATQEAVVQIVKEILGESPV